MKTSRHLLHICFFVLLTLTGCETFDYRNPLTDKQAAVYELGQSNEGFLVGSFTYQGANPNKIAKVFQDPEKFNYSSYSLSFQSLNDEKLLGSISIPTSRFLGRKNADPYFKLEAGRGYVFVIPLPPGDYEFRDFLLSHKGGYATTYWSAREKFSIPFTIESGKAIYIGEVKVIHLFAKNLFGISVPDGGVFVGSDQSERDIPLLKKSYPFLDPVEIEFSVIAESLATVFDVEKISDESEIETPPEDPQTKTKPE